MGTISSPISRFLIVPIALATFACKGSGSQQANAATNDSTQANPVTPAERPSAVHRNEHSSYSTYPAGATPPASAPATHVEKNGGRDAAIGAGAGAILGAVTSKDKVKGGVIGAAAGGILGGVIGNNVDKKTVPNP
jgi:hypothetical protein